MDVRKLKLFTKTDETVISYTYDENGIRTGKTVGSDSVRYILDGNRIIQEKHTDYTLTFIYDDSNTLIGFNYDNGSSSADYYYGIDSFGNINYIYDANGSVVTTYRYDAWGKAISTTGSLASTIGSINPYRYKSYYYDQEISMYYLQSRYYDAEMQRFISADDAKYLIKSANIYSCNIYAYCYAEPVMNSDPRGNAQMYLIGIGIQLEVGTGIFTVGLEIIWYFFDYGVTYNGSPYFYVYGGAGYGGSVGGVGSNVLDAIADIIKKPSLLFNPKSLIKGFSFSVSVFAIWGCGGFFSPYDYEGWFSATYAIAWHAKIYTAWSDICFAVGVGWSSNLFGAGYGKSYYILVTMPKINPRILYMSVFGKASKLKV